MIYELRVYTCNPGMLPALHARFANHAMALFKKHGVKSIGYWTTDVGENNHELTYLLAFEDANQRTRAWGAFRDDPEWQRVFEESHRDGVIVKNVRNQILVPTPYSPMQ